MTQATFTCQPLCSHNERYTALTWKVNETLLSTNNPRNVTTSSESVPNGRMATLTIAAFSEYNTTTIECALLYAHNTVPQTSQSVTLWIQGWSCVKLLTLKVHQNYNVVVRKYFKHHPFS